MSYGGNPFGGGSYAGSTPTPNPLTDSEPILAVEIAFTTGALETPVWVNVTSDVRAWDTLRGRNRELERMQPGRATVVLSNRERQYDSHHATGPHYGNLRPSRRIRIRETFNGVTYPTFDGFIDGWHLDYPGMGFDATATVIATDAFKIFGRRELPRSVYAYEVDRDDPAFWWRFTEGVMEGDEGRTAINQGSVGTAGDGTYVGAVTFGAPRMIVNDADDAVSMTSDDVFAGTPVSGVNIPVSQINLLSRVNSRSPFTLEVWVRPKTSQTQALVFFMRDPTGTISNFSVFWYNNVGGGDSGQFKWRLAKGAANTDIDSGSSSAPPGERYHLVLTGGQEGSNLRRRMYLNGAQVATDAVATNDYASGGVDHNKWGGGVIPGSNFTGELQSGAIYLEALGADRVLVHYEAGAHPWQDDQPGERAGRILDVVGWPADLREPDPGNVALQSASFE